MSHLESSLYHQCLYSGLPEPVQQLMFHPTRRWRWDLCWPDRMLAVEVQGATYAAGRHTRGAGYEADCDKANEAVLLGWRVLRFTAQQVTDGRALRTIERALEAV